MIQRIVRIAVLCALSIPVHAQPADWSGAIVFDLRGTSLLGEIPDGAWLLADSAGGVNVLGTLSATVTDAAVVAPDGVESDDALEAAFRAAAGLSPRLLRIRLGDHTPEAVRRLLLLPNGLLLDALPEDPVARSVLAFRLRHPAVGSGRHEPLVNRVHSFQRSYDRDRVIVVLGATATVNVNVSRTFSDDTLLRDALTGETAFVSFGMARFDPGESGMLLIEPVE